MKTMVMMMMMLTIMMVMVMVMMMMMMMLTMILRTVARVGTCISRVVYAWVVQFGQHMCHPLLQQTGLVRVTDAVHVNAILFPSFLPSEVPKGLL